MNKPTFDAMLAQYEVKETGKNLFDAANATQFSGTCSLTEKTKDGHLTVMTKSSGTYTSVNIQIPIFPEGTEMTLSAKWVASGKNDGGLRIVWQGADKTYLAGSKTFGTINTSGESVTFIMPKQPENAAYLVINFFGNRSSKNAVAGDTVTYSEIMLTFGSDSIKYEPYTGNNKDFVFWDNGVHCVIPSVEIGGKAEQKTYSGKNLFDIERRTLRRFVNSAFSNTTIRDLDEDSFFVGITANNYYAYGNVSSIQIEESPVRVSFETINGLYGIAIPFHLPAGGKYRVSTQGNNLRLSVSFYNVNGEWLSYNATNSNCLTIDMPYNAFWALVIIGGTSSSAYTVNFEKPQLEEGTTETEYEPYTGGIPAPNPNYPIMPVFSEGTMVTGRGKNLFDPEAFFEFYSTVPIKNESARIKRVEKDGRDCFYFKGDSGRNADGSIIFPVEFPANTVHTISFLGRQDDDYEIEESTSGITMQYDDGTSVPCYVAKSKEWTQSTITTKSSATIVSLSISYARGAFVYVDINSIQIEEDTTATEYTPYFDGGTAVAPELLAIPGTEYRDEWNPQTGKGVRRVGKLVLDGTEEWKLMSQTTDYIRFYVSGNPTLGYLAPLSVVSSHFKTVNNGENACWTSGSTGLININIAKSLLSDATIDAFKSYLAAQHVVGTPVTVWYALAEPVSFQAAPQPLIQPKGTCEIIQTEGTVSGCPISAKYLAHK